MTETTMKAKEKSPRPGSLWPDRTVAPLSAAAAVAMPSERQICWNVA